MTRAAGPACVGACDVRRAPPAPFPTPRRFDVRKFYAEARRVLRPTGCLAAFGYVPLEIGFTGNAAATAVLRQALLDSNVYFDQRRQRFVQHLYDGVCAGPSGRRLASRALPRPSLPALPAPAGLEPTRDEFGAVETQRLHMDRERSVDQLVSLSGQGRAGQGGRLSQTNCSKPAPSTAGGLDALDERLGRLRSRPSGGGRSTAGGAGCGAGAARRHHPGPNGLAAHPAAGQAAETSNARGIAH